MVKQTKIIRGYGDLNSILKKIKHKAVNAINKRIALAKRGPRNTATKRFNKFLQSQGNNEIAAISVGRKPIMSGVEKALNTLSFGKFGQTKKKLNYDDVYHNYMIVTLRNGKKYKIEKNHVIEAHETDENGQYNIPLNKDLSLNQLINTASSHDSNFWQYDPRNSNCQVFVNEVLTRNNLKNNVSNEVREQIEPQDSKTLLDSLPKAVQHIPKMITDLAGTADRVVYGDGVIRRRRRKRL